ncbi:MAG: tetratricopeptide repeat protein [Bacteroidota bacterium]
MTKKITWLFILNIALIINSYAQTDSLYSIIKQGNKAYTESNFEQAITNYEQVIKSGYSASELYYNLGNAYYRKLDYKSAILNYERALLLAPDDENILTNLEFSRNHIQDRIEEIPEFFFFKWVDSLVNIFSSKAWSVISITGFILFLFLAILFLFSRTIIIRKLSFLLSILFLFLSALSFYSGLVQNKKLTSHNNAIVFTSSVTVKSAPTSSGTDLFIIHEGLKVKILDSTEGWKEIQLSDGKIGWLPEDAVVEI